MALKWTATTMLDSQLDSYDAGLSTELSAVQKEQWLRDAENSVETLIRQVSGSDFTYDADKHGILRQAAYLDASLMALGAISLSPRTLQEAQMTADIVIKKYDFIIGLLNNQNFVKFIVSR